MSDGEDKPMRECKRGNRGHMSRERFGGVREVDGEEMWLCLVHLDHYEEQEGLR